MIGLIDADIVAFRVAASAENESQEIALLRIDSMMNDILSTTDSYKAFLTGKNNFRYDINPDYKANRKDTVRPQWLDICRSYLVNEYNAIITDGYEADDALGFNQTEDTVIFSIDKDLLMIPGHHYNFIKNEYREVSELDGLKMFYRQMLIGDTSDNIKGVAGIGKVKAAKLIDHLDNETDMFNLVSNYYFNTQAEYDEFNARFFMNADCLWIQREEGVRFSNRYENI